MACNSAKITTTNFIFIACLKTKGGIPENVKTQKAKVKGVKAIKQAKRQQVRVPWGLTVRD